MHATAHARARRFGLNRRLLPTPDTYFEQIGLKLTGHGEWRDAVCPFHDDTRPSLRVRLDSGAFRCMVCGARGRDVIAFHMKLKTLPFIEACKALGAWEVVR